MTSDPVMTLAKSITMSLCSKSGQKNKRAPSKSSNLSISLIKKEPVENTSLEISVVSPISSTLTINNPDLPAKAQVKKYSEKASA